MENSKEKIVSILLIISIILTIIMPISYAESLNEKKQKVNNEIKNNENKVNQIKTEVNNISSDLKNIINQISTKEEEINNLQIEAGDLSNEVKKMETEVESLKKKQEEKQKLLKKRMKAIYMNGSVSYLELLANSEDLTTLISNYNMISQINEVDNKLINQTENERQKIDATSSEIQVKKKIVEEKKNAIEKAKQENENLKRQKEEKVQTLGEEEKKTVAKLDDLKREQAAISNEIMEYERRKQAAIRAARAGKSSGGKSEYIEHYVGGRFGWPVPGNYGITTPYGKGGKYWSSGYHTGVDFASPKGTPIYAANDGIVVSAVYKGAYGMHVIIDHGGGLYTLYAHGSALLVSAGQRVKRGEQIAKVGQTGNAYGNHLHFEVRKGGSGYFNHVNPMPYLR